MKRSLKRVLRLVAISSALVCSVRVMDARAEGGEESGPL